MRALALSLGLVATLASGFLVKSLLSESCEREGREGIAGLKYFWVCWDANLPRFLNKSPGGFFKNVAIFSPPPEKQTRLAIEDSLSFFLAYETQRPNHAGMRPDSRPAAIIFGLMKGRHLKIFGIHKAVIAINNAINGRCGSCIFNSHLKLITKDFAWAVFPKLV